MIAKKYSCFFCFKKPKERRILQITPQFFTIFPELKVFPELIDFRGFVICRPCAKKSRKWLMNQIKDHLEDICFAKNYANN